MQPGHFTVQGFLQCGSKFVALNCCAAHKPATECNQRKRHISWQKVVEESKSFQRSENCSSAADKFGSEFWNIACANEILCSTFISMSRVDGGFYCFPVSWSFSCWKSTTVSWMKRRCCFCINLQKEHKILLMLSCYLVLQYDRANTSSSVYRLYFVRS